MAELPQEQGTSRVHFRHESELPVCQIPGLNTGHLLVLGEAANRDHIGGANETAKIFLRGKEV